MNKGQLYTKIRHKMDMLDVESNTDDYYAEAYPTYIDECLSLIANTVLPYQKIIEVKYGGKLTTNGSKYIVWSENTENPYSNIERIIYIGDKLYTISSNMIKVLDMDTMKEVSKIEF